MEDLLKAFEEKQPEIVFEWKDSETEAVGWAVINSLRNGAAGGGTRMRKGLDKREVESLAKTMEIKFTVSGPSIGGAKSGINFDPNDPRKNEVLKRWYKALLPILKAYYGTGGDLNIDEIHDVIPITSKLGLEHPQEGVVTGHITKDPEIKKQIIGQLQKGVSLLVKNPSFSPDVTVDYTVADLITGFGVAEAVRHTYAIKGEDISKKCALIQGWGNVASAAAYYLATYGVKIVGIIDRDGGMVSKEGLDFDQTLNLFKTKNRNKLNSVDVLPFNELNETIWKTGAEIFIPAAASRLVTMSQLMSLIENGLEVISCGANVPFADTAIFYGPISQFADQNITLIPDFIANCGMARVFAYLMQQNCTVTDTAIFEDVSTIIGNALKPILTHKTGVTKRAYQNSLTQLV